MLETLDLNYQIGNIKNDIAMFGRNDMSLDTKLEDCNQVWLCAKFRDFSLNCRNTKMEEIAKRSSNAVEILFKKPRIFGKVF